MNDDPRNRAKKESDPEEFPHGRAYERLRQFEDQRGLEPSEFDTEDVPDNACGEEQDEDMRRRCGDAAKDTGDPPGDVF